MAVYVDAGYYSYFMGSRISFDLWLTSVDWEFLDHAVFLLDTESTIRLEEYPLYKSRRTENRAKDPRKQEITDRVAKFRTMLSSPSLGLKTRSLKGYEADDLVGILSMVDPTAYQVIGIDKDYAQLPTLGTYFLDGSGIPIRLASKFEEGLPQYASRMILPRPTNRWFSIYQALVGDRSDSIPRVLPTRLVEARRIMAAVFSGDLSSLGDMLPSFYRNLRLTTVPHPSLLVDNPSGQVLFEALHSGTYDLKPLIEKVIRLWQENSPNLRSSPTSLSQT